MASKTKRPMSEQARAAKMIRQGLKTIFPATAFSVKSDSFAGGNAVRIDWTDGPTRRMVEYYVSKFEAGTFDGMTDMYTYDKTRDDVPQAKYVQCQRDYSPDAKIAAIDYINKRYGWNLGYIDHPAQMFGKYEQRRYIQIDTGTDFHTGTTWASHYVDRALQAMSLTCIACNATTLPGDKFCAECGTVTGQDEDIY